MLLDSILTREQKRAGLVLTKDKNVRDMVCLECKGHILATWFGPNIKPTDIQQRAELYLSEIRGMSKKTI